MNSRTAFSLAELVVVVVIIGIISAIAVPRISQAASGAELSALKADLAAMRSALDIYAAEHNSNFPAVLVALDRYSSAAGAISSNPSPVYKYGPYLRKIPPCPIGPRKGATGWAAANASPPTVVSSIPTVGWLYHAATGGVWVNDINHLDK